MLKSQINADVPPDDLPGKLVNRKKHHETKYDEAGRIFAVIIIKKRNFFYEA